MKRFHGYLFYAVLALLFSSGVVWAYFRYLADSSDISADLKSWSLKVHGAAAMATLVLIGTVLVSHVRFAWRAGRNRGNGVLFLSAFGALTITGYGLYYFGNERWRTWTSWIHLAVGLALPLLLLLHLLLGRATRPKVQPRKHPLPHLSGAKISA